MTHLELFAQASWRPLRARRPLRLSRDDTVALRGARAGQVLVVGSAVVRADQHGLVRLHPRVHPGLQAQGALEIHADGQLVGAIELSPGKLSDGEYEFALEELREMWGAACLSGPGVATKAGASAGRLGGCLGPMARSVFRRRAPAPGTPAGWSPSVGRPGHRENDLCTLESSRVYERWVYLQVLLAARSAFGGALAVLPGDWGTTIAFPGGVFVAFEPRVMLGAEGWMGMRCTPKAGTKTGANFVSPDVVVLSEGELPRMVVIDAKYVDRGSVRSQMKRTSDKYGRMARLGKPVPTHVVVAHPNRHLADLWDGRGCVPMVPGDPMLVRSLKQVLEVGLARPAMAERRLRRRRAVPVPPPAAPPGVKRKPTVPKPPLRPPDDECIQTACAAIVDYVARAGHPVRLTDLGSFVRRELPRLLVSPRYAGAERLSIFLHQFLPELTFDGGPDRWTVATASTRAPSAQDEADLLAVIAEAVGVATGVHVPLGHARGVPVHRAATG